MEDKKIFMISVIDDIGSINRRYVDTMMWILNNQSDFQQKYVIQLHTGTHNMDLYRSLEEAIQGEIYDGYIVLLDCIDENKERFNPNVMFEFGGIKNLKKPYIVMAMQSNISKFPFDVKNLNIGFVPEIIKKYIFDSYYGKCESDVRKWFKNNLKEKERTDILNFFSDQYNKFETQLLQYEKKEREKESIIQNLHYLIESHKDLKNEILKITNFVSNTAEYIDGEAAAFSALSEAVDKARYSLRTSRFANESIVKEPTREQDAFMNSLYSASKKLKENSIRIICNNNPCKWQDIYNILFYGGNGSSVYVRKADFSIHFELVIIDELVAFIHFYQQVHSNVSGRGVDNRQVEKLNSTLKIQGSSICQKFARIYDRLHHRDVESDKFEDPSRTLLGIDIDNFDSSDLEKSRNIGYFVIESDKVVSISARHQMIMEMFKQAFETWNLGMKDKSNMAAGIALLETQKTFIDQMKEKKRITQEEYEMASQLFNAYM